MTVLNGFRDVLVVTASDVVVVVDVVVSVAVVVIVVCSFVTG